MYPWQVSGVIEATRVVAIVRAGSDELAVESAEAVLAGGLRVVEVSLTGPGALRAVERLSRTDDGRVIGVGTVLDATSARLAVEAGARFLVAPTVNAEVIATGNRYGLPVLPGAQSVTEAVRALELGAAMIKLFPASTLGVGHLRAVRAALPQLAMVPTGGVSAGNARDWLDAGAVALGVGGSLTSGSPAEIRDQARRLAAVVG